MSGQKPAKKKQSLWQTLRAASSSYRRLYGYVKPYKGRFILGLSLGLAYGGVNSLFPIAISRVTSTIFQTPGAKPMSIGSNLHALDSGPKINSILLICLAIPAIMTVRSLCSYGSTYCMQWVSNKVVSDIRVQLFSKMVRHSMDFFNKMRSGFLMSRITNDTRIMQMALTSVSSDVFKQPITIIGAISVLLVMDWKFTLVTLVLFPTCLLPLRIYGRRAKKAVQNEQEGMAQMVVTMQETFAGIRVIKSFAREGYQEKEFKRSNQMQFSQMMRMIRAMEIVGPLVEIIAAIGVGMALAYVYAANLSVGRFFGLISGIFILYDPIKTLSRIHIVMQRSIAATGAIFGIIDSTPTVQDAPDAVALTSSEGRIDFENVTFRYANTHRDAIKNVTLHIEPGKTFALVGASGAGKSTVLSLILRLYDPTSGAVGDFAEGEPLFDGDQPSAATQAILQFCEQFEAAGLRTNAFVEDLQKSDLLMDGEVAIQPEGFEQPFVYRGFRMVDEEKVRNLRGDELRKMNQNGMLPLIFAHLFSLTQMRDVFARQMQQGKAPNLVPQPDAAIV